jgi:hypothetical protein
MLLSRRDRANRSSAREYSEIPVETWGARERQSDDGDMCFVASCVLVPRTGAWTCVCFEDRRVSGPIRSAASWSLKFDGQCIFDFSRLNCTFPSPPSPRSVMWALAAQMVTQRDHFI